VRESTAYSKAFKKLVWQKSKKSINKYFFRKVPTSKSSLLSIRELVREAAVETFPWCCGRWRTYLTLPAVFEMSIS
jgi:hypothetical protein